jgi:hypothetical protein
MSVFVMAVVHSLLWGTRPGGLAFPTESSSDLSATHLVSKPAEDDSGVVG